MSIPFVVSGVEPRANRERVSGRAGPALRLCGWRRDAQGERGRGARGVGRHEFMAFWVYMLRCADGSYYTGHTDDLERRLAAHRARCTDERTRSW